MDTVYVARPEMQSFARLYRYCNESIESGIVGSHGIIVCRYCGPIWHEITNQRFRRIFTALCVDSHTIDSHTLHGCLLASQHDRREYAGHAELRTA